MAKVAASFLQRWNDAPVVRVQLSQPWGDAGILSAPLVQRWRDMVPLQAGLDRPWSIMAEAQQALVQSWAITAGPVQSLLAQGWSIRDIEPLLATLHQPWSLAEDGSVLRYDVEVLVDGQPVGINHLNIEGDLSQDVLTCEIHLGSEADFLCCSIGAELVITLTAAAVETYHFVVTTPRIDERWGQTTYIVEAMSPAVLLGEPWASAIDGELSGVASAPVAVSVSTCALRAVAWLAPTSMCAAATADTARCVVAGNDAYTTISEGE